MLKERATLVASVLSMALIFGPAAAVAQTAPSPKGEPSVYFLIVDAQGVVDKSKAGKMAAEQLKNKGLELQKGLESERVELEKEANELNKQVGSGSINREVAIKKDKELQQKRMKFLDKKEQINKSYMASRDSALGKISNEVLKIVQEIAKSKDVNLVLDRRFVIMQPDPRFDITADVLQKLDEQLPTLTVEFAAPVASNAPAAPQPPAPAAHPASKKKK